MRSSSGPGRTASPPRSCSPRAGLPVLVVEAEDDARRGPRSAELTLPGFRPRRLLGDPSARASPRRSCARCRSRSTALEWIAAAGGARASVRRRAGRASSLRSRRRDRARRSGPTATRYRRLIGPFVDERRTRCSPTCSRRPRAAASGCARALRAALGARRARWPARSFRGDAARGLFAGCAAHSMLPLDAAADRRFGLVLGAARRTPSAGRSPRRVAGDRRRARRRTCGRSAARSRPAAGSSRSTSCRRRRRASCSTSRRASSLAHRRRPRCPRATGARLERYRYGPGVFKVDWALDGPIPWRAPECAQRRRRCTSAGRSRRSPRRSGEPWRGRHPERPFVLLAQQSLFDPTRAPGGQAHRLGLLPRPARVDGRHDRRASRRRSSGSRPASASGSWRAHTMGRAELEAHNPNYVGGDINGGAADLRQILARPVPRLSPYSTPLPRRLPLLGLDAAGRRRPRHVRLPRGARRARRPLALGRHRLRNEAAGALVLPDPEREPGGEQAQRAGADERVGVRPEPARATRPRPTRRTRRRTGATRRSSRRRSRRARGRSGRP